MPPATSLPPFRGARPVALLVLTAAGACSQGPSPPLDAAEAALRILDGPAGTENEHYGHSLLAPIRWFDEPEGAPLDLVVGGGVKWDGMKRPPSEKVTSIGIYAGAPSKGGSSEQPRLRIAGPWGGDAFGFSLASLERPGERPALVVGAPRGGSFEDPSNERGWVYFFAPEDHDEAAPGTLLEGWRPRLAVHGTQPGTRFGFALLSTADLDGDGFRDVVVGAPGSLALPEYGGEAWLLPGVALQSLLADAPGPIGVDHSRLHAERLSAGDPLDALGAALAFIPAEDSDGSLCIGAPQEHWDRPAERWVGPSAHATGYVRYGSGGDEMSERHGSSPGSGFGRSLLVGELDRVQGTDLMVGAPREGCVRLYSVFGSGPWSELVEVRESDLDQTLGGGFGWSMAGVEQGLVAVGAPDAVSRRADDLDVAPAEFRRGAVWFLHLSESGARARAHVLGEGSRDHLGYALAPTEGGVWAGAHAWPAHPATEEGRVYLLPAP